MDACSDRHVGALILPPSSPPKPLPTKRYLKRKVPRPLTLWSTHGIHRKVDVPRTKRSFFKKPEIALEIPPGPPKPLPTKRYLERKVPRPLTLWSTHRPIVKWSFPNEMQFYRTVYISRNNTIIASRWGCAAGPELAAADGNLSSLKFLELGAILVSTSAAACRASVWDARGPHALAQCMWPPRWRPPSGGCPPPSLQIGIEDLRRAPF